MCVCMCMYVHMCVFVCACVHIHVSWHMCAYAYREQRLTPMDVFHTYVQPHFYHLIVSP